LQIHFPPGQNYDCVMCGRGCESLWSVAVDPHVVERIEKHPLGLRVIDENGAAFERKEDGSYIIHYADPQKPKCGFLDDSKLCRIHAELGMEAKPTTCQQFPFHVTETPDGVFVGVSFFCTSVRENSGRPLHEHEAWLRDLMGRGIRVTTIEADQVQVSAEAKTTWPEYVAFENELRRRQQEQGLDITLQQALVLCARASAQNPCTLAGGFDPFELDEPPLGGQLSSMLDTLLYTLVKLFLDDTTPERIGLLDQAYFQGEPMAMPEFAWDGTWHQLVRFQDTAVGETFEDELDRWAAMQIHRKSLLVYRPMLDNLWMMILIPRFVRVFTALLAHGNKRQQAERSDYFGALEQAEMYLGTNGLLLNRIGPVFTGHLMQLL